jgi:putative DNA primase/helicase
MDVNKEIEKLMQEKGLDREQAWIIAKEREETELTKKLREELSEKEQFNEAVKEETKEREKNELLARFQVFYKDEKGNIKINCPRLAKLIMNDDGNNFIVLRDTQEILWFNGSFYENNGERVIEQRINYYLDEAMTTRNKQETMTFIKTKEFVKREELEPPVNLINLKNGVFDTEKKELLPHSPEYKFLNEIPINYSSNAKIDKIKSFIEDTLDMNDVPLIQEFLGDCLQRNYSYKRAIMCVGPRDTGKTQLLQLIDIFLGHDNVSNVNLWDLCTDRFASIELYRKLANVCSELDPEEITHIDKFLSLTGGDWQSGQKKHQDRFKFRNYAKIIFACNQIPDTTNKNEAFYVRWIVLVFNNIIPFEEQIEDYYKILTTEEELSGLFNWALEGLYRLKEKHGYSEHRTLEQVKELMQKGSNPIREFVDQYIIGDVHGEVTKEYLYLSYVEFCKNMGYPYKADNVFSRMFKPELKHGVTVTEEKIGGKNKRKTFWKGIICTYSRIGDITSLDNFDDKNDTGEQQEKKNV